MVVENSALNSTEMIRLDQFLKSKDSTEFIPCPLEEVNNFKAEFRSLVIERLIHHRLIEEEEKNSFVVLEFYLLAGQGNLPPQEIHTDGTNSKNFGAILYLTNGSWSTEFPSLKYYPQTNEDSHPLAETQELKRMKRYFRENFLLKFPVRKRDLALFHEDLPHRGPGIDGNLRELFFMKIGIARKNNQNIHPEITTIISFEKNDRALNMKKNRGLKRKI